MVKLQITVCRRCWSWCDDGVLIKCNLCYRLWLLRVLHISFVYFSFFVTLLYTLVWQQRRLPPLLLLPLMVPAGDCMCVIKHSLCPVIRGALVQVLQNTHFTHRLTHLKEWIRHLVSATISHGLEALHRCGTSERWVFSAINCPPVDTAPISQSPPNWSLQFTFLKVLLSRPNWKHREITLFTPSCPFSSYKFLPLPSNTLPW